MSEPQTPATAEPTTTDPATPATEPAAAAPPATEPPAEPQKAVWDDPTSAKAEIERLRRENGAARTNAKQAAADEARNELAQTIGKALGIIQNDAPVDPAELTKQVADSQAAQLQAQRELAVFRNAGDADPAALLDSREFVEKLAKVDVNDKDAVSALVAAQVQSNPARFGKAATPQGMKPNPAQGRSATPPLGRGEQIAQAQQAGNLRQVMRLKAAQALETNQT